MKTHHDFGKSILPRPDAFAGFVFICIISTAVLSCGIGVRTRSLFGERLDVKVKIADQANHNSPIALDLLLVYDKALLEELLTLSSREWFERRDQIMRDYMEGRHLDTWAWEWAPGQRVPAKELPLKAKAKAGLVFAQYTTPGVHRVRINPHHDITIHLLDEEFYVEPIE